MDTTEYSGPAQLYSPLADADEIRLLHLLPSTRQDPVVECTIKHFNLKWDLHYEALSYMWGSPTSSNSIEINGKTCSIRENLFSALLHLRHWHTPRTLWIDALCINQEDNSERNHQVHQMGRIYQSALNVVVWLGPSDASSGVAMQFLKRSSNMQISFGISPLAKRPTQEQNIQLRHIKSVFFREYWSRLWIIQEIILAREILVQCGDDTCSWSDLKTFFRQVEEQLSLSWVPWEVAISERERILDEVRGSTLARLVRERHEVQPDFPKSLAKSIELRPLLDLCAEYGEAVCHDKRDKMFGLHSFAASCCINAVPVDYSSPFSKLAGMLLHHHTQRHNSRGDANIITESHLFHHKLEVTVNECGQVASTFQQSLRESVSELEGQDISVAGTVRGRVSYLSPPLHRAMPKDGPEISNLGDLVIRQLEFINPLHKEWHDHRPRQVTRQLDLVYPISYQQHVAHQEIPSLQVPAKETVQDPMKQKLQKLFFWRKSSKEQLVNQQNRQVIKQDLEYLFFKAQEAASNTTEDKCRLAFEETGLVILVPNVVQVGDLVLQFRDSNTLVVTREDLKDRTRSHIVGRAVNFLACSPTAAPDICGDRYDALRHVPAKLQLDVHTLQKITCASASPDPPIADLLELSEASQSLDS